MPQPLVLSGSVYPVLLHGMMIVERFIIHVCLYGARGMPLFPSGHVWGQSVHGGGSAGTGALSWLCGAPMQKGTSARTVIEHRRRDILVEGIRSASLAVKPFG